MYPKAPLTCLRAEPDCAALHLEMRRPGVTLALLHVEFLSAHPDGLRYTAFCDRYRAWQKRQSPVMRQVHVAGDKLFVDYAGMRPRHRRSADRRDHRRRAVRRGARREQLHLRRGDPDAAGPGLRRERLPRADVHRRRAQGDRARPAQERGDHRVSLRPRRAAHDRRAGAPLRDHDPARAPEVPARQGQGRSRRADRRALAPRTHPQRDVRDPGRAQRAARRADTRPQRPPDAHVQGESTPAVRAARQGPRSRRCPPSRSRRPPWKQVALNVDYHLAFDHHFYSAPHALRHDDIELWLRATASTVEIFHGRERVAAHVRSYVRGGYTTVAEHMPSSHRAQAEWTPSRILGWAEQVGPNAPALCEVILRDRRHPEWGYRSCLGSFRLAEASTATSASTRPAGARSTPARAATDPS